MKNIFFAGSSIFFVNYLCNILPLLFWFESDPFSRDWQNFPQQKLWVLVAAIKNILIGKNNMVCSKSWAYFGSKIKFSYKNALNLTEESLKRHSMVPLFKVLLLFYKAISPVYWINLVKLSLFVFMLLMKTCQVWKLSKKFISVLLNGNILFLVQSHSFIKLWVLNNVSQAVTITSRS